MRHLEPTAGDDRPGGGLQAIRWLACALIAFGLCGIGYQILVNASGRPRSHVTLEGPFAGSYTFTDCGISVPFDVSITLSVVSVGAGAALLAAGILAERWAHRR